MIRDNARIFGRNYQKKSLVCSKQSSFSYTIVALATATARWMTPSRPQWFSWWDSLNTALYVFSSLSCKSIVWYVYCRHSWFLLTIAVAEQRLSLSPYVVLRQLELVVVVSVSLPLCVWTTTKHVLAVVEATFLDLVAGFFTHWTVEALASSFTHFKRRTLETYLDDYSPSR